MADEMKSITAKRLAAAEAAKEAAPSPGPAAAAGETKFMV